MLHDVKEIKYGNTRCYCINNKLLVDTDWAGTLPMFFKAIKQNHIDLSLVQHLIITHFHPDHMGIAQELADMGIRIVVFDVQREFVHASDGIFSKDIRVSFQPIDESKVLHISCAESRSFLRKIGIQGEVIPTPGHSDDSVSLILDDGQAFVGDLYPVHSVPAFNNLQLEESWNAILSREIQYIHYAHAPEETLSNVRSIYDIL